MSMIEYKCAECLTVMEYKTIWAVTLRRPQTIMWHQCPSCNARTATEPIFNLIDEAVKVGQKIRTLRY